VQSRDTAPNNALYLPASSGRSCAAPASRHANTR